MYNKSDEKYNARDRFIGRRPTREEKEIARYKLSSSYNKSDSTAYSNALSLALFGISDKQFHQKPILTCTNKTLIEDREEKNRKSISLKRTGPILDARDIVNDFYFSVLAWSQLGLVYIALGDYIWSYRTSTKTVHKCATLGENSTDCFSAIAAAQTNYWYASTRSGVTKVLTAETNQYIRGNTDLSERIVKIEPTSSPAIFYMGGSYNQAYSVDIRRSGWLTSSIDQGEGSGVICGLSFNQNNLLACGMNNNKVKIWDIRNFQSPIYTLSEHNAAVKALEFHPQNENQIASGGGTNDRHIKIWDVITGSQQADFTVNEQVTSVTWSHETKNCLVSTHGYSQNSICLWDLSPKQYSSTASLVTQLSDHNNRILCSARKPGKDLFCTVSADETLRFWKLASTNKENNKNEEPDFRPYSTLR